MDKKACRAFTPGSSLLWRTVSTCGATFKMPVEEADALVSNLDYAFGYKVPRVDPYAGGNHPCHWELTDNNGKVTVDLCDGDTYRLEADSPETLRVAIGIMGIYRS